MNRPFLQKLTRSYESTRSGVTTEQEAELALNEYYELKDDVYRCLITENALVVLVSLTYVTYHVISKLRGNEKNH